MTQLTLMRLNPDTSGSVVYKPFSESDDFTGGWWDDEIYGYEASQHFYAFFMGQHEVARVEIEVQDDLNPEYRRPAHPGPYAVIHFFEVSKDHRRRRHGTAATQLIVGRYRGTPLVAFSEDADEFWGSLGWARYEHADDPGHHRPMYVSAV